MNALLDERAWEGRQYSTLSELAVAMWLHMDGNEFKKSVGEEAEMHTTPSSAGWMLASLYQAGAA